MAPSSDRGPQVVASLVHTARVRRASIAIAAVAALLAACGEKTIDGDRAAESVAEVVSEKTGFEPTDVQCPSDVPAKVDETFECRFTGPEGPYTASVRITKVEGDDAEFFIDTRRSG